MATLTAWKFDSAGGADNALATLERLQRQQLITLIDGAVVTWPDGAKKPKTRQMHNTAAAGALGGAFWGMLFGLIFFIPLIGLAIGAGMGALMGSMTDVGIDDNFIKQVRDKVTPGTSCLFLYTANAVTDRIQDEFKDQLSHMELIQSNLSKEQEDKLREAFGEEPEEAAPTTTA
ncbi:MAG: DUF1269 domain-containing protein [Chloroflexi bacterium]|nr:DUF1269 domain-containing protein [Chloroflexota bacterium]